MIESYLRKADQRHFAWGVHDCLTLCLDWIAQQPSGKPVAKAVLKRYGMRAGLELRYRSMRLKPAMLAEYLAVADKPQAGDAVLAWRPTIGGREAWCIGLLDSCEQMAFRQLDGLIRSKCRGSVAFYNISDDALLKSHFESRQCRQY